jgi:hypothetical protein
MLHDYKLIEFQYMNKERKGQKQNMGGWRQKCYIKS